VLARIAQAPATPSVALRSSGADAAGQPYVAKAMVPSDPDHGRKRSSGYDDRTLGQTPWGQRN
jgi:hypothetical protein